ncbi:MAG: c-type cytochrome [Halioglobus sp.]
MLKPSITAATLFLLAVTGTANADTTPDGKQVYDKVCSHCHDTGKMGAPLLSEPADWEDYDRPIVAADVHAMHIEDGLLREPGEDSDKSVTDAEMEAATAYIVSEISKGQ